MSIFFVFQIDFSLSQLKKNSNEDEEIFNFFIFAIAADGSLRTFDLRVSEDPHKV